MSKTDSRKRKKAFRMRLEGKSYAEIGRTLHMTPRTIRHLENGWTDAKGVRHRGWKQEFERLRAEEERAELGTGLALKAERLKMLKDLVRQAKECFDEKFPNITMKNASDAKAILSELRELSRLIALEVGDLPSGGGGGGTAIAVKTDVTINELQQRYEAAQAVAVDEVPPPEEAHYDVIDPNERDAGAGAPPGVAEDD